MSLGWGWKLHDYHFKESFSGIDPFLEDQFEEFLSLLFFILSLEVNVEDTEHLEDSFSVVVHDVSAESDDWLHDELYEASLEGGAIISLILSLPFFSFSIMVVVTPKFLHHLVEVYLELVRVDSGKLGQGEGPAVEAGSEGD